MGAIDAAQTQGRLLRAQLFDVYRPTVSNASLQMGEKSLAVRLVLSGGAATLTEDEIESTVQSVLTSLQTQLQARLRA
jgi:phenylalanyl-tRNA synthetase beta chain